MLIFSLVQDGILQSLVGWVILKVDEVVVGAAKLYTEREKGAYGQVMKIESAEWRN